jgi:starch phosphorylase
MNGTVAPEAESSLRRVAYFSMEIALEPEIPTYSGGLGVLSGDTLRSAADLGVPMVAITLAHRKGYFRQMLDHSGKQTEAPNHWDPSKLLELMDATASVVIEGRHVQVRAWRYWIKGIGGHRVPVYLLDTDSPENSEWDRTLTDFLYGGDVHYRLCQEVVLGIGGVKILRRLGYEDVTVFHMNEGHASLLALALLEERLGDANLAAATETDIREVRRQCVFTTHTPVPAGFDQFSRELMAQVLGADRAGVLDATHCCPEALLNMTYLGLRFSHYINGVAMHHGAVSQGMFPQYPISAITNGVHAATWTSPAFRNLYDTHIPQWRRDNLYLRYAISISLEQIRTAHQLAKVALLEAIKTRTGLVLDEKILTIGFARRAATYKRFDLLFAQPELLRKISEGNGALQIVYAGKAHPQDEPGKEQIQRVFAFAAQLASPRLRIVYLEDYDMHWGQLLTSGVDLWLNTPQRPFEASGTSGMKAALNGVPSLSILDGWWIEGCLEGTTGWAIGKDSEIQEATDDEADSLYDKLAAITSMFYERPTDYETIMRSAIAINGSFFNSHRMLSQYVTNAYALVDSPAGVAAKEPSAQAPALLSHAG